MNAVQSKRIKSDLSGCPLRDSNQDMERFFMQVNTESMLQGGASKDFQRTKIEHVLSTLTRNIRSNEQMLHIARSIRANQP